MDSYEQKDNEEILREIKQKKKGDYYSILGLPIYCSAEEVKRAYFKLSLKVHPDKNKSPDADQVFKIVSEAYQCLIEQRKFFAQRKTYTCWDMQPSYDWEVAEEEKKKPDSPPPVRPQKPDPQPGWTSKPTYGAPAQEAMVCESCLGYIYGSFCEICDDDYDQFV